MNAGRMIALRFDQALRRLTPRLTILRSPITSGQAVRELGAQLPEERRAELAHVARFARSQLGQDLFALWSTDLKQGGYFVEIGVGDGQYLSNTHLLEDRFGWTGILAEPLPRFQRALSKRRACEVDGRAVWSRSGRRRFIHDLGYFSAISEVGGATPSTRLRRGSRAIQVETVSLIDLLDHHGAPPCVDFLSLDVEGAELEILRSFPFHDRYVINAICCEHNFSPAWPAIHDLLVREGYRQVFPQLSGHDGWFVLNKRQG